jgi:hypothetical protein
MYEFFYIWKIFEFENCLDLKNVRIWKMFRFWEVQTFKKFIFENNSSLQMFIFKIDQF